MTQTASSTSGPAGVLGAALAHRQAGPPPGNRPGLANFMTAYHQAARLSGGPEGNRGPAVQAPALRDRQPSEASAPRNEAPEPRDVVAALEENRQSSDTDAADRSDRSGDCANEIDTEAAATEASTESIADEDAEAAQQDAAHLADEEAAQVALQAALATDNQVGQLVAVAVPIAAATAAVTPVEGAAPTAMTDAGAAVATVAGASALVLAGATPASDAEQAAMLQAVAAAQDEAAVDPAATQKVSAGQARVTSAASGLVAPTELALGQITVEVATSTVTGDVTLETDTPETKAQAAGDSGFLALMASAEAAEQTVTPGSNTQALTLDDAEGVETPLPLVNGSNEETDAIDGDADDDGTTLPIGAGGGTERVATDGARPGAANAIDKAPGQARAEEVLPQILKHADQLKASQQNSIKLQLYPEHLGKMELRVISHQGVLSAQLTAESHTVKAMLESQMAALQRSFAELGLKVDKVEVTLASANLGQDAGAFSFADQGQAFERPNQQPSRLPVASGYAQWLGNEPVDEETYAALDTTSAINYVA